MTQHAPRLVVLDLDNTLIDWVHFYANAFRPLLRFVSDTLGIGEPELAAQFKVVHTHFHSIEFPFSIQRLSATSDLSAEALDNLIAGAREIFGRARDRHLHTYPGALDALEQLRAGGHKLVVVTNAPHPQAERRLQSLGIDRFLTGVVAWEGWTAAQISGSRDGAFVAHRPALPRQASALVTSADLKPATEPYLRACALAGADPATMIVVGDSIRNDLLPGKVLGAAAVWARYGTLLDPEELDLILQITQYDDQQLGLGEPAEPVPFDAELASISELPAVVAALNRSCA